METQSDFKLKKQKDFKNATVYTVENQPTAVVQATGTYITIEEFKEIFKYIGSIVSKEEISKLVFDKTDLTVFHQPSMEWYFVEWKEEIFDKGLRTHRKILPSDDVFRQSVKIGREQINQKYPNRKFHQMDIQYFENLDDAIKN